MGVYELFGVALLSAFIAANWIFPYRWGIAGMICGHVLLLIAYFVFAGTAIELGHYEYHGLVSVIGLASQAFALNCLLLPIALTALWRSVASGSNAG